MIRNSKSENISVATWRCSLFGVCPRKLSNMRNFLLKEGIMQHEMWVRLTLSISHFFWPYITFYLIIPRYLMFRCMILDYGESIDHAVEAAIKIKKFSKYLFVLFAP